MQYNITKYPSSPKEKKCDHRKIFNLSTTLRPSFQYAKQFSYPNFWMKRDVYHSNTQLNSKKNKKI